MKVAILGLFPIYRFARELGIGKSPEKRITSWNENLFWAFPEHNKINIHFITYSRIIKKTTTIHVTPNKKITYIYIPPKINTLTFFYYLWWRTNFIINKIKPDLVHGIGTEHIWGRIALGYQRHIITIHGILNEVIKKNRIPLISLKRYLAYQEKIVLKNVNNLIAINPYVVEKCYFNKSTKVFFIENAVSPIFREKMAHPERSNQILFIGDYIPLKNVLFLYKALNVIYKKSDFRLKVIGRYLDKEYKNKIARYLENKPFLRDKIININFRLPEELMEDMLESALLVVTSNQETAPMVIAEAMSMGLPVIATNVGGIRYMIRHNETGMIVEPNDIRELSDSLLKLLNNPKLRKTMGENARKEAIEKYDPKVIANKTIEAYKKILGYEDEYSLS